MATDNRDSQRAGQIEQFDERFADHALDAVQGLIAAGVAYGVVEWAVTARRPRVLAARG
jgi:hypothetical protein